MAQNKSHAVMHQRAEANDSLDDFPTPPWATRAACNYIARLSPMRLDRMSCREPCVNRGHMLRPLQEYFAYIDAFDVHDYGLGIPVSDYLFPIPLTELDWTFLNPPFRLAEQFIQRALETSHQGVAVIVRSGFLEGVGRFERLFSISPPSYVLQFAERVPMAKGRLCSDTVTATSYSWLIWFKHRKGPTLFDWIAPCRRELEIEGDYPETPDGLAELHREPRA